MPFYRVSGVLIFFQPLVHPAMFWIPPSRRPTNRHIVTYIMYVLASITLGFIVMKELNNIFPFRLSHVWAKQPGVNICLLIKKQD